MGFKLTSEIFFKKDSYIHFEQFQYLGLSHTKM